MLKNLLVIIGVIGGTVGAFFAYSVYFVEPQQVDPLAAIGDDFIGREIVMELERIRAISLDTKLFESPAYQSLVDRSPEIAPEPVGRPNPFAPIGGGVRSVVTTGTGTSPSVNR